MNPKLAFVIFFLFIMLVLFGCSKKEIKEEIIPDCRMLKIELRDACCERSLREFQSDDCVGRWDPEQDTCTILCGDPESKDNFCGTSTLDNCEEDNDCVTGGCHGFICMGIDGSEFRDTEPSFYMDEEGQLHENMDYRYSDCEVLDCEDASAYNLRCKCEDNQCRWN